MPGKDILILQALTETPPALSKRTNAEKNKIIIDSITNSYDLYSLSKSFLEQFDIDKKSIFYNILNEAIHEIILSE